MLFRSKNQQPAPNLFEAPVSKKKEDPMAIDPVLSNQRPAPWLGAHIFGFLTTGFIILFIALIAYKAMS